MIPITRPSIGTEEAEAAGAVILTGWLSQGPKVQAFERAVAGYVGAREGVATSNCTTALHLALIAAGVGTGDEVICPSFSFIATANAIVHVGAVPVFVDVDPRTYNINPALIEAAVTPRTRAVVPVDQIGLPAPIETVASEAQRLGLKVVEDAAPSLGSRIGEARIGALTDFTCFSFHPRKSITTAEGGVITTNDPDAAVRLRVLRSHGASVSDLARHQSGTTDIEEYRELGYNYRMSDVHAAIGLVQLAKLDAILAERRRLAQSYDELLGPVEEVCTPFVPPGYVHTYQSYCVRLRSPRSRAEIMRELAEKGIATRRGVMAIHLEPYYRRRFPDVSLPVTEQATQDTLLLPIFPGLTTDEQLQVTSALIAAVKRR